MLGVVFRVNDSSNFPFGLPFHDNRVPLRAVLAWNSGVPFSCPWSLSRKGSQIVQGESGQRTGQEVMPEVGHYGAHGDGVQYKQNELV